MNVLHYPHTYDGAFAARLTIPSHLQRDDVEDGGEERKLFVPLLLLLYCIVLRRHMGFACYGCAVHDVALGGWEGWVGRQSMGIA